MKGKRKRELRTGKFTCEFKEAAVRRLELGESAAEVARACNLNADVLLISLL